MERWHARRFMACAMTDIYHGEEGVLVNNSGECFAVRAVSFTGSIDRTDTDLLFHLVLLQPCTEEQINHGQALRVRFADTKRQGLGGVLCAKLTNGVVHMRVERPNRAGA